jgi:hypothetical protein
MRTGHAQEDVVSIFPGIWSFDHLDLIWHLNLVIWHSCTESKLFQAKSKIWDHT